MYTRMNNIYFQTIHQIITTGHWITDQVSMTLKEYGITEPQYNVLRVLKSADGKPLSVQTLLENMVQRNSNITRIVDKLVSKGFADRQECPTNRRKMDIKITKEGMRILKKLDAKVFGFHEPYTTKLEQEEIRNIKETYFKI